MKNKVLLVCLFAFMCLSGNAASVENSNLLPNSDFEQDKDTNGIPDGWIFIPRGSTEISIDSTRAHRGTKSIKIAHDKTNTYTRLTTAHGISLIPQTDYVFQGWVKIDWDTPLKANGPESHFVQLVISGLNGKTVGCCKILRGTMGEWHFISIRFNSRNNKKVFPMAYLHKVSGVVWFDDFELFKGKKGHIKKDTATKLSQKQNFPRIWFTPQTIIKQKRFYVFKNNVSRLSVQYYGTLKKGEKLELVIDAPPGVYIIADFLNAISPTGEKVSKRGRPFTRYTLPVPSTFVIPKISDRACHTLLIKTTEAFKRGAKLYYRLKKKEELSEEKEIPLLAIDWPNKPMHNPKNFKVKTIYAFPLRACPKASAFTTFFKKLAGTYLKAGINGSSVFSTTDERIIWLRQKGWSFGAISGFGPGDKLKGMRSAIDKDGKNFSRNIICPTWFLENKGPAKVSMRYTRYNMLFAGSVGKDIFDWQLFDYEPHSEGWTKCVCPLCLQAFSKKLGVDISTLNPEKIKTELQKKWKEFRVEQNVMIVAEFEKATKEQLNKSQKFSINANPSTFWPPAVMDPYVDFHSPMIYYYHPAAYFDVIRSETKRFKKPMIPTLHITQAGINQWVTPKELKLELLSTATAGGKGIFLWMGTHSLGALALVKIREALDIIAQLEPYLDKGIRQKEILSIVSKDGNRLYNYDVHRLGDSYLISMFNFNDQKEIFLNVRLRKDLTGEYSLLDPLDNIQLCLRKNKRDWNENDLKRGFSVSVPAYEARFIVLKPFSKSDRNDMTLLAPASVSKKKGTEAYNVIKAAQALVAPTLDGNIQETLWKNSNKIGAFTVIDDIASEQTEAFCAYDADNLYFAIRCHESKINDLKTTVTKKDGRLWDDDCVELFIQSDNPDIYYQIIVNSNGVVFDKIGYMTNGTDNPDWNSGVVVGTSVHKDKRVWEVELAVPRAALKLDTATKINFNICRERKKFGTNGKIEENSSWIPSFGNFSLPRFGKLILQKK